MRRIVRLAVIAAAIGGALAVAEPVQGQDGVAGTWVTEFPRRVVNGEGSDFAKARLTLEVKGDSVFGTYQVFEPAADPAPPARRLKGTNVNGTLTLEGEPMEARVRMGGGDDSPVMMRQTYVLKVANGELTGTIEAASTDGTINARPRPFTAKRESA